MINREFLASYLVDENTLDDQFRPQSLTVVAPDEIILVVAAPEHI